MCSTEHNEMLATSALIRLQEKWNLYDIMTLSENKTRKTRRAWLDNTCILIKCPAFTGPGCFPSLPEQ